MAEWRDRGYVPDSDDEEELETQESPQRSLTTTPSDVRENRSISRSVQHAGGDERLFEAPLASDLHNTWPLGVSSQILGQNVPNGEGKLAIVVDVRKDLIKSLQPFSDVPNPTEQHANTSENATSLQLEANIKSALQTVHDVLSSTTSSPLSSVPPSPRDLIVRHEVDRNTDTQDNQSEELDSALGTVVHSTHPGQRPQRAFRPRDAIQLHPFSLEYARYQQSLKSRGVRPVRVEQPARQLSPTLGETRDPARERGDLPDSSSPAIPGLPSSSLASSKLEDSESLGPHELASSPTFGVDWTLSDAELPEIDAVLHAQPNNRKRHLSKAWDARDEHGFKTRVRREFPPDNIFDFPYEENVLPPNAPEDRLQSPPASVTGSPTDSPTTASLRPAGGFQVPRSFSPANWLTPAASSITRPQKTRVIDIFETSSSSSGEGGAAVRSPSVSTHSMSPAKETRQLERIQRRIKGVLPASWLKLDLKTQHVKSGRSTKRQSSASPIKVNEARGVAKRVRVDSRRSLSPLGEHNRAILISDVSSSGDKSPLSLNENRLGSGGSSVETPYNDAFGIDAAEEDNRIDWLLSPAARERSDYETAREKRKRQTRIDQERPVADRKVRQRSLLLAQRPSKTERQPRITEHVTRMRKKASSGHFKPPELGVLDAPDFADIPSARVPRFLKLAARHARSRQDQGRHSPTKKYFRLSTRADTEDVQTVLTDWRRGNIPQSRPLAQESAVTHPRQPLRARPDNSQRFSRDKAQKSTTDGTTRALIDNILARQASSSRKQPARASTLRVGSIATSPLRSPPALRTSGPRHLLITTLGPTPRPRVAQLETVDDRQEPRQGRQTAYPDTPHAVTRLLERKGAIDPSHSGISIPLTRFLEDDEEAASLAQCPIPVPQRARKRSPRRINADGKEYRQPMGLSPETVAPINTDALLSTDKVVLRGLRPFPATYTYSFDIEPLRHGTFYHQSTYLGSGELARAVGKASAPRRDLDKPCGQIHLLIEEKEFRWGCWGSEVSFELQVYIDVVCFYLDEISMLTIEQLSTTSNLVKGTSLADIKTLLDKGGMALKGIISYVAKFLSFFDPVDRDSFVSTASCLTKELRNRTKSLIERIVMRSPESLRFASYLTLLACQVVDISHHERVSALSRQEAQSNVTCLAEDLALLVVRGNGLSHVRTFLEHNRDRSRLEAGVGNEYPEVEALVFLHTVLKKSQEGGPSFWNIFSSAIVSSNKRAIDDVTDVQDLDKIWYDIFTVLPVLEIDPCGILRHDSRFEARDEGWGVVKPLISRVMHIYASNPPRQSASFNAYCRALTHRCFHLAKFWAWQDCRPVIDLWFDFFSKKQLSNLHHERSNGSPNFLQNPTSTPINILDVEPKDCCFHILLKIISLGFKYMLKTITDQRKIRNFTWRLIPNHGRQHPKHKSVLEEDLEALQNHHDLLCTLYWAAPFACRPPVAMIRGLVHLADSHIEACRINLLAWFRLAQFQVSTAEDKSLLEPLLVWFEDFAAQMLHQHAQARAEVDNETRGLQVPSSLIDSTVQFNQGKVGDLLRNALSFFGVVVSMCKRIDFVSTLLPRETILNVFSLFDPRSSSLTNSTVSKALIIVSASLASWKRLRSAGGSVDASEDSQEYGDWALFQDMVTSDGDNIISRLYNEVYEALTRLVSKCFADEPGPEETFLYTIADTYSSVAQVLVEQNFRTWDQFIDLHEGESWVGLRNTPQTRKFAPCFLAMVLEKDPGSYENNRFLVLGSWLSSIVERDALLHSQHRLTTTLLNLDRTNPLFDNLPFVTYNGQYELQLDEFRQRRLSLISSLLSNMRMDLALTTIAGSARGGPARAEYSGLLKRLMTSMKAKYLELGRGSAVQGAYVAFIHHVVGYLQQHTSDICPIDKFFVDDTSFPLPRADPAYVVGKLKHYGLRLSDPRVPKQLVGFVQSVSERAALDDQQSMLATWFEMAMADAFEAGNVEHPTLRAFLFQHVFSAYFELAFYGEAWILLRPALYATKQVYANLLSDIDTGDDACVRCVVSITRSLLRSVQIGLEATSLTQIMQDPRHINTLTAHYTWIIEAMPVVDLMERQSDYTSGLVELVEDFRSLALQIAEAFVDGHAPIVAPHWQKVRTTPSVRYREARALAAREAKISALERWTCHEGRYYVVRGNQRFEILKKPGTLQDERGDLREAIEKFFDVVKRLAVGGEPEVLSAQAYCADLDPIMF